MSTILVGTEQKKKRVSLAREPTTPPLARPAGGIPYPGSAAEVAEASVAAFPQAVTTEVPSATPLMPLRTIFNNYIPDAEHAVVVEDGGILLRQMNTAQTQKMARSLTKKCNVVWYWVLGLDVFVA